MTGVWVAEADRTGNLHVIPLDGFAHSHQAGCTCRPHWQAESSCGGHVDRWAFTHRPQDGRGPGSFTCREGRPVPLPPV